MNGHCSIFLSQNFDAKASFVRDIVTKVAQKHKIDVKVAPPGNAAVNPAEQVRAILASVEGLLALIDTETSWLSNEIGMAYAQHLPIAVITSNESKAQGISRLVTSIKQARLT